MKRTVLTIIILTLLFSFASCGGGTGDKGMEGSWHCTEVCYLGEKVQPSTDEQKSDYTLSVAGDSFELNLYGTVLSGTLAQSDSLNGGGKLETGTDVELYDLNTDAGYTFLACYYVGKNMLVVFLNDSVDEDNYVQFERD